MSLAQRLLADIEVGQEIDPIEFPLSVYRLVMAAGATRDFNSIHHNSEYARSTGADEMYAATSLLLGTWERALRELIGPAGTLRSIKGFRMRAFNPVGSTIIVRGRVLAAHEEHGVGVVEVELWCENGGVVTVGPGTAVVTVPVKADP
jgi:acyl dehydratase